MTAVSELQRTTRRNRPALQQNSDSSYSRSMQNPFVRHTLPIPPQHRRVLRVFGVGPEPTRCDAELLPPGDYSLSTVPAVNSRNGCREARLPKGVPWPRTESNKATAGHTLEMFSYHTRRSNPLHVSIKPAFVQFIGCPVLHEQLGTLHVFFSTSACVSFLQKAFRYSTRVCNLEVCIHDGARTLE